MLQTTLTVWLLFFLLPSAGHEIIFYVPSSGTEFFSMFTVQHGLFSLVLMFPELRFEVLPLFTAQGKSIKRRTRKFNFRSYVLNPVQINISFCLSNVGSPEAKLSASRATLLNRAGRFIGHPCHNSRIKWADLLTIRAKQTIFLGGFNCQPQPKG